MKIINIAIEIYLDIIIDIEQDAFKNMSVSLACRLV